MRDIKDKDLDIRTTVIRQLISAHKSLMCSAVKVMENDNLTRTEIMILFMIKRQKYKTSDLAKEIGIPASTLTGVVDRLVERGYLERQRDENDRRVVFIKPGKLSIEKSKQAHDKLLSLMKNSDMLLSDQWWTDLSQKLEILENIIKEKSEELR